MVFSYDRLSTCLAMVLTGVLALGEFPQRHVGRARSATILGIMASGVAACVSNDLLTLCLLWGAIDLYTPLMMRHTASRQIPRRTARFALFGMLATMALLVATLLMMRQQGHTHLDFTGLSSDILFWLSLAAILRLGTWPLQGNYSSWEGALLALCTGGCLWLRLAPVLATTALPALAALGSMVLLVTSLLAASAPRSPLPYVFFHGVTIVIVAPLCDAAPGALVALVSIVNLGLCLGVLRLDRRLPALLARGWSRLPGGAALASLAGFPLTLGFVSHVGLLRLYGQVDKRALVIASLSLLVLAVPLWRRWLYPEPPPARETPHHWGDWLAFASACLMAAGVVLWGIAPGLLAMGYVVPAVVPSLAGLLRGHDAVVLLLAAVIVPLGGSYLLARGLSSAKGASSAGMARLGTVMELDWLYAGLEAGLARLGKWASYALVELEGSLALIWTLLWSLALVLLLMGG